MQQYVVLQVVLKEEFLAGTKSKNLQELEDVINTQAAKGYRLHTISTTSGGSKGFGGGDRIQATMVFERIDNITNFRHPAPVQAAVPTYKTLANMTDEEIVEKEEWARRVTGAPSNL